MILLPYIYLTAIALGFASWGYWARSAPFIFAAGVMFIITGFMYVLPEAAGGGIQLKYGTHSWYNYTAEACEQNCMVNDVLTYDKYLSVTGWYPNVFATIYILLGLYLMYATWFDKRVHESLNL